MKSVLHVRIKTESFVFIPVTQESKWTGNTLWSYHFFFCSSLFFSKEILTWRLYLVTIFLLYNLHMVSLWVKSNTFVRLSDRFEHTIAAPGGAAQRQAAANIVGDGVSALCDEIVLVCLQCWCANVASSGASSCAGRGGRTGRRSASRRRTGRVWRPCVSGNGASARPNGRNASRSCPTYTCTASHPCES